MLKGYTLPRTPRGTSSLAPAPPWHYVGNALAVEFAADAAAAAAFLPDGLKLDSERCAAYFIEWQYVSESGVEYLDPITSQYRETIILLSARCNGSPVAYCPFIWVDQDVSLMRGLAQGWPKQIGSTWITRAYDLPSRHLPSSGRAGASALEPVAEVGGGIKVAAVQDPFGNRFGIIENPHFDVSTVR